jgi:hypothetical protein
MTWLQKVLERVLRGTADAASHRQVRNVIVTHKLGEIGDGED